MRHLFDSLILTAVLVLSCCTGSEHFLTDGDYRRQVESDFICRMEMLSECEATDEVLRTLDKSECPQEREALMFLYAYMPLGDLADYGGKLWTDGVRTAFEARREMPWGKNIPENLFRHFVLPLRVNNENLDSCRTVFYSELKDRVRGMNIHDAILEVNHWCHEKVVYSPSDARTSAPLATMKTSWGRCGEESVFCAAALRAVGIPARQVYTPRWAHTDDNHAWVEVWADGVWHYLGACEPEPELDIAWFTTAVQRGVLMHTKAFGRYPGEGADVIARTACYTELNVTENYVPVSKVDVQVVDKDDVPVPGALTEFKIYNYAEFYTGIKSLTDDSGRVAATFGRGDVLVWASKDDMFGYKKVSVGPNSEEARGFLRRMVDRMTGYVPGTVTVILDKTVGDEFADEIDIVPPPAVDVPNRLCQAAADSNKVRLASEDSIRNAYVATFPEGDKYTVSAFGNWEEVESFIFFNSSTPQRKKCAERMLDLMNAKDLRDTPCDILMDHILGYYAKCGSDSPIQDYILNPRVSNEMLVPYVEFFNGRYGDSLSVDEIIGITKQIRVMDNQNPARIPVTPIGVARIGAADSHSRDIFFVSLCRTSGVPSRLDPVDGDPQYLKGGVWTDVDFGSSMDSEMHPKGELVLEYEKNSSLDNPKYEIHFTLSKLDEGSPALQNFSDNEGMEGSATWNSVFKSGVSLESGSYMLVTGTRMASGKVLSTISVFNVPENGTVKVPLVMRQAEDELQVIGSMNAEDIISVLTCTGDSITVNESSILSVTGRGYFVLCFAVSGNEPCNHSIQSLLSESPRFPSIILFPSAAEYQKVNWNTFPTVPEKVYMAVDENGLMKSICSELKISDPQMPLTVIADTFGRIVYVSQGYNIGLAEQLKRL